MYGGYPPMQPPPSPDELLAPARRAGVLMIVIAVLFVLFGLCMGLASWIITLPEFTSSPEFAEAQKHFQEAEAQAGMPVQTLLMIAGAVPLAVGALFGGLGFFVRGGAFVTVIIAIVVTVVLLLLSGLLSLATLIAGLSGDPTQAIGACIYLVPFALLVLLLIWLIQAARAASQLTLARQQQQMQMWQYQQYQQAYLQQNSQGPPQQTSAPPPAGMGYYYVPPPQAPAQTPPAAPSPPAAEQKDPPDAPASQG
jgi:hypothetical protein